MHIMVLKALRRAVATHHPLLSPRRFRQGNKAGKADDILTEKSEKKRKNKPINGAITTTVDEPQLKTAAHKQPFPSHLMYPTLSSLPSAPPLPSLNSTTL
jgi:hypothetical protein